MSNEGSMLDKVQRMINAKEKDESPLVEALRAINLEADRNTGSAYENMTLGDVTGRWSSGIEFSFEVQVSTTHDRFSYTAKKLTHYVGVNPEQAYVLLGCKDGEEMLYMIFHAFELHSLLHKQTQLSTGIWKNGEGGREYYVINPPMAASTIQCVAGRTLLDAVTAWNNRVWNVGA